MEIVTSPNLKSARTPRQRTRLLWEAIQDIAADYDRLSIRQLYYQLVSRGVLEKTEPAYKRVCDASAQMRLSGALPYGKIADGHRVRRAVFAHDGVADALEAAQLLYRRNMWSTQPVHVEIWTEKDALTGVILPVCNRYGVTYVATRGFPSVTLMYESAQELQRMGKSARVLYFGDHDASGHQISANLEPALRQHGADVTVERVALNLDQVDGWGLPTRPGKRSDTRHAAFAKRFGDASVELDAVPPDVLTDLVATAIEAHMDEAEWFRMRDVERAERQTLADLVGMIGGEAA